MRNIICWDAIPGEMLERDFSITPKNYCKKMFDKASNNADVDTEEYYFSLISGRAKLYRRCSERWNFAKIAGHVWKQFFEKRASPIPLTDKSVSILGGIL